jgi:hypothetical protein
MRLCADENGMMQLTCHSRHLPPQSKGLKPREGFRRWIYNCLQDSPYLLQIGSGRELVWIALWYGHLREGTIWMTESKQPRFDAAAFLENAGLGRRVVQLKPKHAFFSQGGPLTPSSIFRPAALNSPSSHKTAKKPPSRFSPRVTLLERSRSQRWVGGI